MKSKTILIVDNDPAFAESASSILEREGYLLKTAVDGAEAYSIIKESVNGGLQIDLLLTDLRMPNMSGLELVRNLKTDGIPVAILVTSGFGDAKTLKDLIHYGVDEFVAKPCTVAELVSAVQSALQKNANVSLVGGGI